MTAKKATAADRPAPVEAAAAAGRETIETAMRAGRDAIGMIDVETAAETAREQAGKAQQALFDGYDRMAALNQANFEACAASFGLAARGAEAIGKEIVGYARTSLQAGVDNSKAMLACKTVNEAVERQGAILCGGLDTALAGAARLAEMSVAAADEALAPVRKQANDALGELFRPSAS